MKNADTATQIVAAQAASLRACCRVNAHTASNRPTPRIGSTTHNGMPSHTAGVIKADHPGSYWLSHMSPWTRKRSSAKASGTGGAGIQRRPSA